MNLESNALFKIDPGKGLKRFVFRNSKVSSRKINYV